MSLELDVVSGKSLSLELWQRPKSVPTTESAFDAGGADGTGNDDAADEDGCDPDDDDDGAAVAAAATVLSNNEDILLCGHLTSMARFSPITWTVHENQMKTMSSNVYGLFFFFENIKTVFAVKISLKNAMEQKSYAVIYVK